MKKVRFAADGALRQGRWDQGQLIDDSGRAFSEDQVVWLPPVTPGKIIGLALNYREHAGELGLEEPGEPVLFFKPPSSLIGHRGTIRYPDGATHCHYETELAVVMGRPCRRVSESQALEYVQGYTVANDFTCRDFIRNTFRPPVRAKGFDTFLPLGPWLVTADEIPDPGRLDLETAVNGTVCQRGNTRHLTWSVPELIAYLSQVMTLEAGDIILTGTPPGITPVHPGDVIQCTVGGVGQLINPVGEDIVAP